MCPVRNVTYVSGRSHQSEQNCEPRVCTGAIDIGEFLRNLIGRNGAGRHLQQQHDLRMAEECGFVILIPSSSDFPVSIP
jgi:hypothetical protein